MGRVRLDTLLAERGHHRRDTEAVAQTDADQGEAEDHRHRHDHAPGAEPVHDLAGHQQRHDRAGRDRQQHQAQP